MKPIRRSLSSPPTPGSFGPAGAADGAGGVGGEASGGGTTPPPLEEGVHAMRRGGARREVTERAYLHGSRGELHEGWALNVSRGGVRVILEENVELGSEYDVTVGDPDKGGAGGRGRIVWIQEEPDGIIAGIEFVGLSGTHKSRPPPAP